MAVKEYIQDNNGEVTVEYDTGVVSKFNVATINTRLGDAQGIVISTSAPVDSDGRPDGTIYLHITG